jgi:hypothetical protein
MRSDYEQTKLQCKGERMIILEEVATPNAENEQNTETIDPAKKDTVKSLKEILEDIFSYI